MSHLCETGSHLPGMLSARLQVSQRWERHAVNENLAGLGGRRAVPGVQEVAATVCGLLTAENLPESFKTQMSSRNRHKTVPQGVSDAGVWGFFCLRLILPPFIFQYAACPLRRAGVGEDLGSSFFLHVPSASVCDW